MNYFPFHLGDYAADTAHLEPMEDLAYRRMLDLYYRTERVLPSSVDDIARLVRLKGMEACIASVLKEFFSECSDGWAHARCDAELAKMQDKQAKARASAQASVNARSTNAQRALNERSTVVELPTPTPTPRKEKTTAHASRFAEFWGLWPKSVRKGGKPECLKVWTSRGFDSKAELILTHVKAMSDTPNWRKEEGAFIPAPVVYLRGERWDGAEVETETAFAGGV